MPDLPITRRFNRFELKYLLTLKQAQSFKEDLLAYVLPDEHGCNQGRYTLTSLYYDSPDYRCYHEKVDGLRARRKLRIRYYEDDAVFTDQTPVFVEIKERIDRITRKRRILLSYAEALELCNDRHLPARRPQDEDILEELLAFVWEYDLRPSSIVRYARQAFSGTRFDPGLRITFDTQLAYQIEPLYLHDKPTGLLMLPANRVVMEIKINDRIPVWLSDLIAAHNLQIDRISKYCQSIEMAQNQFCLPINVRPVETAADILSSTLSVFNTPEPAVGVRKKNGEKHGDF